MELDIAAGLLCCQGRLLLGKRSAHRTAYPGVWDLPGGHVEAGETAEQTLVRELHEELGVMPIQWREWAVLRAPAMGEMGDEGARMLRVHLFLVTQWDGEPRNLLPDEHDAIAWFTLEDAAKLTLAHADYPRIFRDALAVAQ
ncbi:MAG TPA: NUDIX domain-containing protein [Ktedonobacterales bacterium]|nr:NUDIX domain-containing protein [Ktedonobacterales bacterium]